MVSLQSCLLCVLGLMLWDWWAGLLEARLREVPWLLEMTSSCAAGLGPQSSSAESQLFPTLGQLVWAFS